MPAVRQRDRFRIAMEISVSCGAPTMPSIAGSVSRGRRGRRDRSAASAARPQDVCRPQVAWIAVRGAPADGLARPIG